MMLLSHGREETADTYATAVARRRATHRLAPASLTLCAGLLIAAAPAAAQAAGSEGPLLSGYGGPGAGEQAILGSQVLRSHPHHGGGGGEQGSAEEAGGAAGAARESVSPEASLQGSSPAPNQPSAPSGARGGGGEASGGTPPPAHTGHGGSSGTPANGSSPREGTQTAVVAAQPLGLSGGDLAAVIVVACALVSLGVLTRFAARGER
jgi:hypothetical protein